MNWKAEETAGNLAEVQARHRDNRAAWNEGAESYTRRREEGVRQLAAGASNLHPVERRNLERFGPLSRWCKRAVHLQCASGYDTLSLVLEGVHEVVGVDISDTHIENARWMSEKLNMPARWYCRDVLETPAELDGTADLVYTGRGAVNWLHDIDAWACVAFRVLRKGGVLSLLEDHPASWLFSQEGSSLEASGLDYFGHAELSRGWPDPFIGDPDKAGRDHTVKHERLWTLADVFQALVEAGFTVNYLGEHPDEYWTAFPNLSQKDKEKLPMTYSVVATKPK